MQAFKKPLLPDQEEYYLKLCRAGDADARRILIESNMRLVAHIAKKYIGTADNDDLLSVGTIGLIKAIDSYDHAKGNRLVTYASRCIDNELLMMLRHSRKYAREASLFEPIGTDKEGNEINLIDIISQDEATILDSMVHAYHINRLPYCLKHCLSEQEASLIIRRYGLYGHPPRTQKEIASQMGISRSYVSRIEKRALQKIRRQLEA